MSMYDAYDAIVFFEEQVTPERLEALRRALATDPALAEAFARWRAARAALRGSLDRHVPDRHLLVRWALADAGSSGLLTEEEHRLLEEARPALERAFRLHPGLADVVRRIQADAVAFEAVWAAHSGGEDPSPASFPARRPRAAGRVPRRRPALRWAWRAAAAVAVFAFAAVLTLVLQRDRHLLTVQAPPDSLRTVELADGSTIRLGRGARLVYPDPAAEAGAARRVRLEGQALFDVAPAEQPFTVETAAAVATALGTIFSVQAGAGLTEVVLASGRVALAPKAAPDRMVVLEPGQMSRVAAGALPSTPAPVDVTEALDWTGLFVFRATPLADVAARLGAHHGTSVGVAPALAEEQVSGTFGKDWPLDEVLATLAASLGADVEALPDGTYRLMPSPLPDVQRY